MEIRDIFELSVIWLIVVVGLMALIRGAQFVVFQIATYDKGPILAISALVGGLGAVLKALS